jgi:ribosome-binding factor A
MSESIVQKRTAKLILQELADIFSHELTYLPGALLTISQVRVPPDLGMAKVYVSVLPDARLEEAATTLNEHAWEVRHALSRRIRNKLRKMPELRFYADDSFKEAERINRLLDSMEIPEDTPSEENE